MMKLKRFSIYNSNKEQIQEAKKELIDYGVYSSSPDVFTIILDDQKLIFISSIKKDDPHWDDYRYIVRDSMDLINADQVYYVEGNPSKGTRVPAKMVEGYKVQLIPSYEMLTAEKLAKYLNKHVPN